MEPWPESTSCGAGIYRHSMGKSTAHINTDTDKRVAGFRSSPISDIPQTASQHQTAHHRQQAKRIVFFKRAWVSVPR
ncbi:MAG: hypothetical protein R3D26_12225 [Cyanobacteriota/Melainabacteria group bacterium]